MSYSDNRALDKLQLERLAAEYYDQLDFSHGEKTKPQFCLAMIGLVGAGKSTVLKQLCERLPLVRQSADEIREIMIAKGLPTDDAPIVGGMVAERLKTEGYNVAHDNDFANPAIRAEFDERNLKLGVQTVWIRIAPPESFILHNLQNRRDYKESHVFSNADEAVSSYYKRKELHQMQAVALDALPYAYVFDPSREDLALQIDEAADCIAKLLDK
jgi:predicted kinase